MLQPELLKKVIDALEVSRIDYMVTGSIASSIYGPPRLTYDIDIIIEIAPINLDSLLSAFPGPRYYHDRETILDAINQKSEFNIIDSETGGKIDFWVLPDDSYNKTRFARRRLAKFYDKEFYIAGPEDVILMKLKWAVMSGGSEKQFQDALGVYENAFYFLDMDYLAKWSSALKVDTLYQQLKDRARIPDDSRR